MTNRLPVRDPEPVVQQGVRCSACQEEIFSNHRHDFVGCKCGRTFVDGGWDYLRVGYQTEDGIPVNVTRTLSQKPQVPFRKERKTRQDKKGR